MGIESRAAVVFGIDGSRVTDDDAATSLELRRACLNVDSVLSLTRLAERGDVVIGNLAKLVLSMVEAIRELERRAGLAELALEAEREKVSRVRAALLSGRMTGLAPEHAAELADLVG